MENEKKVYKIIGSPTNENNMITINTVKKVFINDTLCFM